MEQIKCEDYFIIKVRYYASDYILKKWRYNNDHTPKQHWERAVASGELFWALSEYVTGKSQEQYGNEYFLDLKHWAQEDLKEVHGIFIDEGGKCFNYMIPKNKVNVYNWLINYLKETDKLPFKEVKKIRLGYYDMRLPSYWFQTRKEARNKAQKVFNQLNTTTNESIV